MKYRVNEIFCSIQGEGRFTGCPAVFIRFSGCQLQCDWCDTDHSKFKEMTTDEILDACRLIAKPKRIILTGGEPMLQITKGDLVRRLGEEFYLHIETNGEIDNIPEAIYRSLFHVAISPKTDKARNITGWNLANECGRHNISCELKVVDDGHDLSWADKWRCMKYLQPLADQNDCQKNIANLEGTLQKVLCNPEWKMSLQTHKLINIR